MKIQESELELYFLYETDINSPISVRCGFSGDRIYFESIEEARNANVSGMFKDRAKYKVGKIKRYIKIVDEYLSENVDPPSETELINKHWEEETIKKITSDLEKEGIVDPEKAMAAMFSRMFFAKLDKEIIQGSK